MLYGQLCATMEFMHLHYCSLKVLLITSKLGFIILTNKWKNFISRMNQTIVNAVSWTEDTCDLDNYSIAFITSMALRGIISLWPCSFWFYPGLYRSLFIRLALTLWWMIMIRHLIVKRNCTHFVQLLNCIVVLGQWVLSM